jgi:hypothetical protein
MNTPALSFALLFVAMACATAIEVPKQAPLTRYAQLWTQSPFTTPPPPPESAPPPNPFEDMVLRGIIPLDKGGYLITLIDKKDPSKVTRIDTESKNAEFQVDKVEREPGNRLATLVHLTKGSMTGTVGYDEALSVVKQAPPPQQRAPQPGQPPQVAPGMPQIPQPNVGQPGSRSPRQRVVQPPTPAAIPQQSPFNRPPPSSSGSSSRSSSSSSRDRGSSRGGPPFGRR